MALDLTARSAFYAEGRFRADRTVLVEPLPNHSLAGSDLGAEAGLSQVVASDVGGEYLHNRNK